MNYSVECPGLFVIGRRIEISSNSDWLPWTSPWHDCVVLSNISVRSNPTFTCYWKYPASKNHTGIICSEPMIDELSSGVPLDVIELRKQLLLRSLSANRLELKLDGIPKMLCDRDHYFILPSGEIAFPTCVNGIIALKPDTLSQLPDTKIQLDRLGRESFTLGQRSSHSFYQYVLKCTQTMCIPDTADLYFPANIPRSNAFQHSSNCIIRITSRVCRETAACVLYLPFNFSCQDSVTLSRTVVDHNGLESNTVLGIFNCDV
jgi:hypothetical protein